MQLQNSQLLDNIYKLCGICSHLCANIEYGLCYLLLPTKWKKHWVHLEHSKKEIREKISNIEKWSLAQKRFDKALAIVERDIDSLYQCSLGSLIKQLKDQCPLDESQIEFLHKILKERNFITHDIWGKYGKQLVNPAAQEKMLKELLECEQFFREASKWVWEQAHRINGTIEFEKTLSVPSFGRPEASS